MIFIALVAAQPLFPVSPKDVVVERNATTLRMPYMVQEPDPAKSAVECRWVDNPESRTKRQVCATVGEWEAVSATMQSSKK